MSLKHVVIGGGTGFIGSNLVKRLSSEGFKCTTISRMPGPKRLSWLDLERYGLPEDTTAVINVAGQNVLDPLRRWTPGFKQNVRDSRVRTTKTLADAIVKTKAETFVTISGVSYYKPDNEITYTEESQCEKYDFLSELCHDWENAARLPKDSPIKQVTIRSGVVLGRGGGIFRTLFPMFYFNLGARLGSGKQYMPWIHIEDLTNIFLLALRHKELCGIVNGVAPQIITNKEFTKALSKSMRIFTFLIAPSFAVNILFSPERAKLLLEGQKVSPKHLQSFGYDFLYPNIYSACRELMKDGTYPKLFE